MSLLPSHATKRDEHPDDHVQLWRMRWFYFIVLVSWIFVSIIATIVTFLITKNSLSLSLFSTITPPAYLSYRLAKYLFPMSQKDFQLAQLKLQRSQPRRTRDNKTIFSSLGQHTASASHEGYSTIKIPSGLDGYNDDMGMEGLDNE